MAVLLSACGDRSGTDRYGPAFKSAIFVYGYVQGDLGFLHECLLIDPDRSTLYVERIRRHQLAAIPIIRRIRTIWVTELSRKGEPTEGVLRLMSHTIGDGLPQQAVAENPTAFLDTCRDGTEDETSIAMAGLRKSYPEQMRDIDAWK
ncbi:MAG TPA: hypothetical protein VJ476_15980 [Rhizomicrobium sp.]|nr:hypothetical protein [Rhizomicrobium sp.]